MKQNVLRLLKHLGAGRHQDGDIFTIPSVTPRSFTVPPSFSLEDAFVLKVQEGVHPIRAFHIHVAPLATISAARSSTGDKLLAPEGEATITAIAGVNKDSGTINKHQKPNAFFEKDPAP
jgi:hypothetical protein